MATQFNFNGNLIKLPGVYTDIKSGINNAPAELSYGRLLILDTNAASNYGGGAGISGESAQGEDAVYEFDNVRDLQRFVGGGDLFDIAKPLFKPFGQLAQGVSRVLLVRALSTTAAIFELTLAGGSIAFKAKYEGLVGNGVELDGELTKGFAITMEAGIADPAKFRFKFWRGTYKGKDAQGNELGLSEAESKPVVVATSPELSTVTELIAWANKNYDFNNYFTLGATTVGTDAITSTDLTNIAGNQLFAGGTQTANPADLEAALSTVKALDYTFSLSLDYGANALSANNLRIQDHLESEAKYQKYLVVAGGHDKDTFASESIAAAETFNSSRVIVTHGGCKVAGAGFGLSTKSALYKAALVVGRTCGLAPQTPITFKAIDIAGEVHRMTDAEREVALESGVLTTYYDSEIAGGVFAITQGVNTLQNNDNVVNEDGTSHQISVERIAAQLNKEIQVNAKNQLLGNQQQGPNRATLSPEVVVEYVENFLKTKEASQTEDNLIISSRNVVAVIDQDAYKITYEFEPNFEINKLFITGLIIDPNLV